MERLYVIHSLEFSRYAILLLDYRINDIPYGIWRDLVCVSYRSDTIEEGELFYFDSIRSLEKGKEILHGGLWKEK